MNKFANPSFESMSFNKNKIHCSIKLEDKKEVRGHKGTGSLFNGGHFAEKFLCQYSVM